MERPSEGGAHRAAENRGPETPAPRRLVAVRLVAVSCGEARSDRDVGLALTDDREQPGELLDRVLPVGVDPSDELVLALVGERVAGRDALLEPAVLSEGEDFGSVFLSDGRRSVRGAVVDDENVSLWETGAQLVENGG